MRSLLVLALVASVIGVEGDAQEPRQAEKVELTKAIYLVKGIHCPGCVMPLEASLKKAKGVQSVAVNFPGRNVNITFDESAITAQELARTMAQTPHMMGPAMQYSGALVLKVVGIKDKATAKKTTVALSAVKGVGKIVLSPVQEAVSAEFTGREKVSSKQLLDALDKAGLQAALYGATPQSGEPQRK